MHACMHTYKHTNIQTYKHTSKQTYKQTYKHTNIQTYTHTYIHTHIFQYIYILFINYRFWPVESWWSLARGTPRKPGWVMRDHEDTLGILAESLGDAWILDGNFMSKPRWGWVLEVPGRVGASLHISSLEINKTPDLEIWPCLGTACNTSKRCFVCVLIKYLSCFLARLWQDGQ